MDDSLIVSQKYPETKKNLTKNQIRNQNDQDQSRTFDLTYRMRYLLLPLLSEITLYAILLVLLPYSTTMKTVLIFLSSASSTKK